jgi:outer membrane protein
MRIVFMIAMVIGMAIPSMAQKFGHINSNKLLMAMPERETAEKQIEEQATLYDQELQNMQAEFQKKYEEYLGKAETWPEAIRKSKEKELRQLEQGMQDFSQTAQQDLAKLEEDLLTPLIDRARKAIEDVGKENGFTYIFDVSTGATLYNGGEDVMGLVKAKLGIPEEAAGE